MVNKELNEQEKKVNTEHDALAKLILGMTLKRGKTEEVKKLRDQELAQEDWKEYFKFRLENWEDGGWVISCDPHSMFRSVVYKFEEILNMEATDFMKENKELTQKVEDYMLENEELKTEIEVHLEALETAGKERWTQKEAWQKAVADSDKEKEELKRQLCLANKPLPSLPILPKKQSKFQKLGTKIKTKFQNLAKKIKHQEKEFVAQIEVKVN